MPKRALNESDSELSDLDSNISFNEMEDEVVVSSRHRRSQRMSNRDPTFDNKAEHVVEESHEEPAESHYPKRRRNFIFGNLSESKLGSPRATEIQSSPTPPATRNKFKPSLPNPSGPGVKGVLLGTWRHSSVPDDERKHAVIGFIDASGRLRARIQPNTKHGESLTEDYPLPSGPGRNWVTFERIIFSDHLVGLDYYQVKEYIRIRSEAALEDPEDGRAGAELAAVQEAICRVKADPAMEKLTHPPTIAYGVDRPRSLGVPVRLDLKHRSVNVGLTAATPAPPEIVLQPASMPTPQKSITIPQTQPSMDSLPGAQPTHILIGYWKPSSEVDTKDRHAVYGVLDQNAVFHAKVVRKTRDGRFANDKYAYRAGASCIPYEDIDFEPHLKALNRQEVVEYCRVRQSQLDHEETPAERVENETKAVDKAQIRAGMMTYMQSHDVTVPGSAASPPGEGDERLNGRHCYGGYEPRQSREIEPRSIQASLGKHERHPNRLQSVEALGRPRALARCEIARAEAAQSRADDVAIHQERAVAAGPANTANAGTVTAAQSSTLPVLHYHHTNDRMPLHISKDMQQRSTVGSRQETLCVKSSSGDVKIYEGRKLDRKVTGPFMGKLVSQGTIINIDGDDYVEYRVLTKPSFF